MAELTGLSALFERMEAWRDKNHQKRPRRAYVSPLLAARIATRLVESGCYDAPKAGEPLTQVYGCDWFEDTTLTGEDLRFEA